MNRKLYITPMCDTWRFPNLMTPQTDAGASSGDFQIPARQNLLYS